MTEEKLQVLEKKEFGNIFRHKGAEVSNSQYYTNGNFMIDTNHVLMLATDIREAIVSWTASVV
jgi:hypothetical protein